MKNKLKEKCANAGHPETIVRIACRELESFYLGDPVAVEKGLNLENIRKRDRKKLFAEPDIIDQPSKWLKQITANKYDKIDGSRKIAPYLNPQINTSWSFRMLYKTLCQLLEAGTSTTEHP